MPINITTLPVGSYVKDPSTLFNGVPIKWRILDFNHAGYPAGTVTLFAWNVRKSMSVNPELTIYADKTFRSIPVASTTGGGVVGDHIDAFYESLGSKFKGKVVDTPLDITYSSNYTGYSPRYRKENHKVFLFGAKEFNPGGSTGLSGAPSQVYFKQMADYSSPPLYSVLGIPNTPGILSRDVAISSSSNYNIYPGYISYRSGSYATSSMTVGFFPIVNISTTDLTVLDEKDADNCYILNLTENKFLVEDNNDIKRYVIGWETVGQKPATKEMFDQYGMKDFSQVISSDWDKLNSSSAEILCWTDEVSATTLRYLHRTVVQNGILLKMTESITVNELQSIRLDSLTTAGASVKIAISGDDGVTWYGSNGLIEELTMVSLSASGYSASQLNALSNRQLNAILKSNRVRIALFLEKQNVSDTLEVKALFATEVKYLSTPTVGNQTVTYELAQKQTPSYFVSKDDGLNWLELKEDELTLLAKTPIGSKLKIKVKLQNGIELHGLSYSWG